MRILFAVGLVLLFLAGCGAQKTEPPKQNIGVIEVTDTTSVEYDTLGFVPPQRPPGKEKH